jgi:ferredoxin
VEACPVDALSLVSAGDPPRPKRRKAQLDAEQCLGCGVCVPTCRHDSMQLIQRDERVIPPLNSVHRTVLAALERGTLPNLLFDDPEQISHRTMGAVLGAVLKLPPVQRATASEQLRSRYLESLLERFYHYDPTDTGG